MTRFARMAKKKFLEATSWEELSQQKQAESEETCSGEQQKEDQKTKPESSKSEKKKKKSKKRDHVDNEDLDEPVSTPKKKKKDDSKASGSKSERKKDKMKGNSHSKDSFQKTKLQKDTLKDNAKLNEGQTMKVKSFRSKREEKLERQREARRRRRAKQKGLTCFHCRQLGHLAAECPQINQVGAGIGVCYKCGSSDHTTKNCKDNSAAKADNPFPFAKCFICGETGHLSRGCPDNPKGLYPKGGGCNVCGSVEHLRRDCPKAIQSRKKEGNFRVKGSINYSKAKCTSADAEVHSDEEKPHHHKLYKKKSKTVKF